MKGGNKGSLCVSDFCFAGTSAHDELQVALLVDTQPARNRQYVSLVFRQNVTSGEKGQAGQQR
jgi:hypothetical protein